MLPPFISEETSLRAPNNFVFPTDNLVMTIGQWYQFYSAPEYSSAYIIVPKNTQHKNKAKSKPHAFSVELYINIGQVGPPRFDLLPFRPEPPLRLVQYLDRTGDLELIAAGKAGSKRKASTTPSASASKRPRGLSFHWYLRSFREVDWRVRGDFSTIHADTSLVLCLRWEYSCTYSTDALCDRDTLQEDNLSCIG